MNSRKKKKRNPGPVKRKAERIKMSEFILNSHKFFNQVEIPFTIISRYSLRTYCVTILFLEAPAGTHQRPSAGGHHEPGSIREQLDPEPGDSGH